MKETGPQVLYSLLAPRRNREGTRAGFHTSRLSLRFFFQINQI